MSLADAEKYARKVRDARDVAELANNTNRALEAIIREIKGFAEQGVERGKPVTSRRAPAWPIEEQVRSQKGKSVPVDHSPSTWRRCSSRISSATLVR
jgi:hypothetical protein